MDGSTFNEQILQGARPNFFELLSEEAMHEALRPAFQYIIKILVQSRPDWFERVWRFSDEVYFVFEVLLQLQFVRRYSGSFSECFYSLKRVPHARPTDPLQRKEKVVSIICLAAIPYLKVKLDLLFSKLQERDDAAPLRWDRSTTINQRAVFLFFKAYPYIQSMWEVTKLSFHLMYLFNKSKYYSPLHCAAGLTLQRVSEKDEEGDAYSGSWLEWLAGNSFPLFVFSLKFLQWWYSADTSEAVRRMTALPVPPPPQKMKPHAGGVGLPSDPTLCPLCGRHRTIPTVLSSSGYVFCYLCIHGYVREHGECPVTCLPSSIQQLIRLYLPHQHS